MTSPDHELDDQQRELCAVVVMRSMLEDYTAQTGSSFEDAFFRFARSPAYSMLFDYSTGLWKEGPDYLRGIFEETLS
jgi:hypothetical protein